jgi:hypothetical protein
VDLVSLKRIRTRFLQKPRAVDLVAGAAEAGGGEQGAGSSAVGVLVSRRGGAREGGVQVDLQGAVELAAVADSAVAAHAAHGGVTAVTGLVAGDAALPGGEPPGPLDVGEQGLEHR